VRGRKPIAAVLAVENLAAPKKGGTMSALPSPGSAADESYRRNDRPEFTIGQMACEFGVTLRTLRFYEDKGMLKPRREGTSRFYAGPDRLRLQMILKGKQLGFTLSEIRELIGSGGGGSSAEFEEKLHPDQIVNQIGHLERQRAEVEDAIARLRETHRRLAGALTGSSGAGALGASTSVASSAASDA
jgi:DNA-binding transcriptional MerR regulator